MKTQRILFLAVCAALGACNGTTPDDGAAPVPTRDLGDVVPRVLHKRATPAVTRGLAQAAMPVSPRDRVLTPKQGTERLTFRGAFKRVAANHMPIEIPVDTVGPETWLYIQPAATGDALKDALADIQVMSPTGEQIHAGDGAMHLAALPKGVFRIVAGERAKQSGMAIELVQPDSPLVLALETTSVVHFPGDSTRVDVALFDGKTPLTNARVTAELVSPDGSRSTQLGVQEIGAGIYHVLVAPALRLDDPTGVYSVRVMAEGTTPSGVRFAKTGSVAARYGVPTARLTHVMPLRVVRSGASIEAFEVDVRIEVASTDRYEVTGLVAATHKGKLRRVCAAQTSEVLEPGERTLTLRFDAGLVKLTRLQGNFHLEQLQLFSQGRAELLHRIPQGLSAIRTPKVKSAELVEVRERTPAIDEMIAQGLFAPE